MSKKLKTMPIPAAWHSCPWRDLLPGRLPEDWRAVISQGAGKGFTAYEREDGLHVIVSANRERDGKEWLHVSCSRFDRCPSYEEMAEVKKLFCGVHNYAAMIFPPRSEHVSDHDFCLHLWTCLAGWPLPDMRIEMADGRFTI